MGAAATSQQKWCGPRSPEKTSEAARTFTSVQSTLMPLIKAFKGDVRIPVVPLPHEDSNEINAAYHAVRNRPFSYSDQGYPICIFLPSSANELAPLVRGLSAVAVRNHLDEKGIRVSVCGGCRASFIRPGTAVR